MAGNSCGWRRAASTNAPNTKVANTDVVEQNDSVISKQRPAKTAIITTTYIIARTQAKFNYKRNKKKMIMPTNKYKNNEEN